jgi:hypothetical protein
MALNDVLPLLRDCRSGVARLPLTFLASPRKRKQKKATAFAALRVPVCAGQKMGNERNSPAAQTAFISDPFSALHKRQLTSGIQSKKQVQKQVQSQCVCW